jgi:two-component system cell cycle sensor histidine kinase/response regulator CckA
VLVLLDLIRPVLDGAETAAVLRERRPDLPIVVMSGIADDDALRRFGQVRINGFIPKPFAPDQLAQAIAIALRSVAPEGGALTPAESDYADEAGTAGGDRQVSGV